MFDPAPGRPGDANDALHVAARAARDQLRQRRVFRAATAAPATLDAVVDDDGELAAALGNVGGVGTRLTLPTVNQRGKGNTAETAAVPAQTYAARLWHWVARQAATAFFGFVHHAVLHFAALVTAALLSPYYDTPWPTLAPLRPPAPAWGTQRGGGGGGNVHPAAFVDPLFARPSSSRSAADRRNFDSGLQKYVATRVTYVVLTLAESAWVGLAATAVFAALLWWQCYPRHYRHALASSLLWGRFYEGQLALEMTAVRQCLAGFCAGLLVTRVDWALGLHGGHDDAAVVVAYALHGWVWALLISWAFGAWSAASALHRPPRTID